MIPSLSALQQGSGEAFSTFHHTLARPLYLYLFRLTKDQELAEDLLQESWLHFARAIPRLKEPCNLRAFVFTIARNTFLDEKRRKKLPMLDVDEESIDPELPPDTRLEYRTSLMNLTHIFETLPLSYQEILYLSIREEFSAQQISEIIHLSPEATRKRLERARKELTQAWKQQEQP